MYISTECDFVGGVPSSGRHRGAGRGVSNVEKGKKRHCHFGILGEYGMLHVPNSPLILTLLSRKYGCVVHMLCGSASR